MGRKLLAASAPAAPERLPRAGRAENVMVYRFFCWECFRTVVSADDFPPLCRRCGKRMELVAACLMGAREATELERAEREYEAERRRRAEMARRSAAGRACGRVQQGAFLFGHF
ncbi:hypothetical protein [Desulfovirgula thermocuniculi]|uniref:hypothetical protein n=1 Tax=Desulfovirgula thermocuniculi TaxID=348842 RepID=UPI000411DCAD|nr:hypothetical protein [Desulfovirgula thermocuniculi]